MEQKGTLKYRKLQRTPQSGENAGKKKWYATAVTDREVDFEGFVSHISDHGSPYSRGTIHGVLMDALDHLQELILDGKSVRLSDLGLFSIGMTSKAEDTKEKVTVNLIPGNKIAVSVRDNGKGMDEKELSGLWSRYYRGTNTKEQPESSGLGLAIAKQIIALHGGDISVVSNLGFGTEFIILLPYGAGLN